MNVRKKFTIISSQAFQEDSPTDNPKKVYSYTARMRNTNNLTKTRENETFNVSKYRSENSKNESDKDLIDAKKVFFVFELIMSLQMRIREEMKLKAI